MEHSLLLLQYVLYVPRGTLSLAKNFLLEGLQMWPYHEKFLVRITEIYQQVEIALEGGILSVHLLSGQ